VTIFVLLGTLAFVDGTLCGFRAAAGRNPRIFMTGYYRRALVRGAVFAVATIAVFLLVALGLVGAGVAWTELELTAARLVMVYGAFASLVLLALGLYLVGSFDFAVLASVLVLGPFTLLRPWVIAGGAVWAALVAPSWLAGALAVVAGATMVGFERLLDVGSPPWRGLEGDR